MLHKQAESMVDSDIYTAPSVAVEFPLLLGITSEPVDEILLVVTVAPAEQGAKNEWDPFCLWELLQTGAYKHWSLFQQGKSKPEIS